MSNEEEKSLVDEYRDFWTVAEEIARQDLDKYPLTGKETARDRVEKHLLGMLEMYSVKYGSSEEAINYRGAWKALKASFLTTPIDSWSRVELKNHLAFLEMDFQIDITSVLLRTPPSS